LLAGLKLGAEYTSVFVFEFLAVSDDGASDRSIVDV